MGYRGVCGSIEYECLIVFRWMGLFVSGVLRIFSFVTVLYVEDMRWLGDVCIVVPSVCGYLNILLLILFCYNRFIAMNMTLCMWTMWFYLDLSVFNGVFVLGF